MEILTGLTSAMLVKMVTYSTYEAKAKLSEILRKVRAGQKVVMGFAAME